MISTPSYRPQCGVLLSNGFRHFCRAASCKKCTLQSCRKRSQIFVRRCELCSDLGATVSFIAPLGEEISFENFRRRQHDGIDHRRGVDRHWRSFGLIARFDGCSVRGVAHIGHLGADDLRGLISPAEVAPMEAFAAETVSQILGTGRFVPLPGSLKNIFLTINPRCHGRRARIAAHGFDEPMPIVF